MGEIEKNSGEVEREDSLKTMYRGGQEYFEFTNGGTARLGTPLVWSNRCKTLAKMSHIDIVIVARVP